jgi:hypothetical protein
MNKTTHDHTQDSNDRRRIPKESDVAPHPIIGITEEPDLVRPIRQNQHHRSRAREKAADTKRPTVPAAVVNANRHDRRKKDRDEYDRKAPGLGSVVGGLDQDRDADGHGGDRAEHQTQ